MPGASPSGRVVPRAKASATVDPFGEEDSPTPRARKTRVPTPRPSALVVKEHISKRDWVVPKTRPGAIELLPVTDDWSLSIRRIGMRSKEAKLDGIGPVTIYPAVYSPTGALYLGFARKYAPDSIGRRWLFWDFPTQFRNVDVRVTDELLSDFGDHLSDAVVLSTLPEKKVLVPGVYQVKWVVNNRLIDNGDKFRYMVHKTEPDR